jgi:NADPH:quinone reductase-like Zn-dependent oxidoreductase
MKEKANYQPRNDKVLVRVLSIGKSEGGVALPEISIEGKEFVVEAVGPKVEDLEVGDRVLMIGKINEDYCFLPRSHELLVIPEKNILLRVRPS